MTRAAGEAWSAGAAYERFMGRWSRPVAARFLEWLAPPAGAVWLDVGCGTGALTETILAVAAPTRVEAIDASEAQVEHARSRLADRRAGFRVADARRLPERDGVFDAVVAGLSLNFVSPSEAAVAEMARVARPGGLVAAYVWDYAEGMQLLRRFWDAAAALDPRAEALDEARRFPFCRPEALRSLLERAGLADVSSRAIEVPMRFHDFEECWAPFLGGQGPAPGYATMLGEADRARLRDRLRGALEPGPDGSIDLTARAWAVRGHLRPEVSDRAMEERL